MHPLKFEMCTVVLSNRSTFQEGRLMRCFSLSLIRDACGASVFLRWQVVKATTRIPHLRPGGDTHDDNDNDTLRQVPHPSNEGLALQARV